MTPRTDREYAAERSGTPTGELVSQLSEQLSRLVRAEMRLAVTEIRRKGRRAGLGAGMFGVAGVCAFFGGAVLIACAVLALSLVWPAWLAALVVGAAMLVIGGGLAMAGRGSLRKATPPVPEWAMESVKEDIDTIKRGVHHE
ncbi:MAG TPA: phage holin family protein [Pseudonocardiaceae bacterium]|jgi:VIT1/CCC1 family predicted Fe2+/Mn2+ transporter|nr:phage holin family protein [Pseudonocardiaceae bacterium]